MIKYKLLIVRFNMNIYIYMVLNSCDGSDVLLSSLYLAWCVGQPRADSAQHQNVRRGVQFLAGDHFTDIWI